MGACGGRDMPVSHWCILAAGVLPYIATLIAKAGAPYDNRNPRQWLGSLGGWRARANAAQQNSFEAFPLFAAGVIVAHQLGADAARVDALAITFIVARIGYLAAYLADRAALRSLAWFLGIGCVVAIFLLAA